MRTIRIGMALCVVLIIAAALIAVPRDQVSSQTPRVTPHRGIARTLEVMNGRAVPNPRERFVSTGLVNAYLESVERTLAPGIERTGTPPPPVSAAGLGCANTFFGPINNVRVNQDCSFRRQAEEAIAIDPNDPNHLIASSNDSRIGFNHCGVEASFNRGRTWIDTGVPPLWSFILRNGHTSDAGTDPTMAFDSNSNAYFSCLLFSPFYAENAIVVVKSNAAFGGTFYHSVAPGPTQHLGTSPSAVVNEADPAIAHDKQFLNIDTYATSPKRNNLYVTWTRFRFACGSSGDGYCESPIYFSQSANGGVTWSAPIRISGRSASLCAFGNFFDPALPADECNFDQGSWPEVGPDGTVYVFFNNANTETLVGQQMLVKCPGTADCTNVANWTAPVRVAHDHATQPVFLAANAFGCPVGRQCLPPNGYRMNDFGVGRIDPSTGRLYFAWSDFRNGGPCADAGGLPVLPCANINNDVFIVSSTDGGMTWSAPRRVNGDGGTSAQWQAWMAVGPSGNIHVAYYDRQYGSCETTGCNDITLATSHDRGNTFQYRRVTTASMPNLVPTNNPVQAGFLGDYMFVAADRAGVVLVWADTRPHAGTIPEEDIYFARFP